LLVLAAGEPLADLGAAGCTPGCFDEQAARVRVAGLAGCSKV